MLPVPGRPFSPLVEFFQGRGAAVENSPVVGEQLRAAVRGADVLTVLSGDSQDQDAFVETLERWKIPVTVRDTRGSEIDGACGQLAAVGRSEGLGS